MPAYCTDSVEVPIGTLHETLRHLAIPGYEAGEHVVSLRLRRDRRGYAKNQKSACGSYSPVCLMDFEHSDNNNFGFQYGLPFGFQNGLPFGFHSLVKSANILVSRPLASKRGHREEIS